MFNKRNVESISNIDFTVQDLPLQSFEQYEFTGCIFSNISGTDFTDCSFIGCNMSNAVITNCKMFDVEFVDCKLIGVNFSDTKDFGFSVRFEKCRLDYTNFDNKKLNKSAFLNCKINGADFTQADLSKSRFVNCDLMASVFSYTNLSGVDFTTSQNFTIDPAINNVKKAKFLSSDLAGLLTKFDIIIK